MITGINQCDYFGYFCKKTFPIKFYNRFDKCFQKMTLQIKQIVTAVKTPNDAAPTSG